MFDFLPPLLKRLYQSFRVPYARGTRVRETPERDPEIAVSMRERMFRVEIIQDAFCERRPKPQRLFRKPSGHRDMESWCDLEVSRYPGARHRCAHCTETRALFKRANDGDWQAECRLHRLATRASIRLLAQRRAWAETRRRQRAARTPEPGPPPVIWIMLGWKRWRDRKREYPPATDRWFIVERRAAEAKLVRAHTRKLQRMYQRSRARARDRELARDRDVVGRKSAERAFRHLDPGEQAADAPAPSSRGAQRRGDPGQRDKRLSCGPGSPRRQSATRNDGDDHAAGLREPPAEATPAEPAAQPAPPATAPAPEPAPRIALIPYPPGAKTVIKIGAGRPTIPPPRPARRVAHAAPANPFLAAKDDAAAATPSPQGPRAETTDGRSDPTPHGRAVRPGRYAHNDDVTPSAPRGPPTVPK